MVAVLVMLCEPNVTAAVCAAELLEQLQHLAVQPTTEDEFQQRLDALREDQPTTNTAIPSQSIDDRFAEVQRLVQGGPTPAQTGRVSTSAGTSSAAVASTSAGIGAQLGTLQAQTLAGDSTGTFLHHSVHECMRYSA